LSSFTLVYHGKSFLLGCGIVLYIDFVYGAPAMDDRPAIREPIKSHVKKLNGPYLILGDFNQLKDLQDKLGSQPNIKG